MTRGIFLKVLCVILPTVGLIFLLRSLGWAQLSEALSNLSTGWIALLLALAALEAASDGTGLWIATGRKGGVGFAIAVNSAGAITNLILPFEAGEVLKGTLLRGRIGAQAAVSGTIVWNYIFKLTRPLVSLAATLVGVTLYALPDRNRLVVILACGAAAFLPYAVLRLLVRHGAAKSFLRVMGMLPVVGRHSPKWIDAAAAIDDEIRQFWQEHPTEYWLLFTSQILGRLLGWATIHVLLLSLGINQGFALSSLVFALLTVADYLVTVLPARIGVSEGSTYFLFQFLALPAPLGVILYAVLRIRTVAGNLALLPLALVSRNTLTQIPHAPPAPIVANKRPCP